MADPAAVGNAEIFDPSKERKKKKKKVLDLDSVLLGGSSSATPAATADDDGGQEAGTGSTPGDDLQSGELGGDAHDDILESLADFGGKKKKKKAKKVEIDAADLVIDVDLGSGGGGDEEALDFGKKKKKKVKAAIGLDDLVAGGGGGVGGEETRGDGGEELTNQQLPPPIVVVTTTTPPSDEEGGVEQQEEPCLFYDADDPSNTTSDIQFNDGTASDDDDDNNSPQKDDVVAAPVTLVKSWLNSDRDYTYDELLDRVFEIMRAKNPEMVSGTKQKFVMRPPQVVRIGTKKTSFVNFMEICKMLHRHQKHLLDFLLSELGTSGSIDGNNQLIIKGRFQQKQIENVLRRYIKEYVTCHTCRSPNTLLQKDFRLFFLQCEACGSRCSVASIKHGFQAQVSKRAAMRAKAN